LLSTSVTHAEDYAVSVDEEVSVESYDYISVDDYSNYNVESVQAQDDIAVCDIASGSVYDEVSVSEVYPFSSINDEVVCDLSSENLVTDVESYRVKDDRVSSDALTVDLTCDVYYYEGEDVTAEADYGLESDLYEDGDKGIFKKILVTDEMRNVLKEINKLRSRAGVSTLRMSDDLNYVADKRVNEITRKFSHIRPNGKSSSSILLENGISYGRAGENIAFGISTAEGVVSAWSDSPTHNRCMMNGNYTHAGIGTVTVNGCTYWALILRD
jgi:uncharacterized protein YkwD